MNDHQMVEMLLDMHDKICARPPGAERDEAFARFFRMVRQLEEIPARLMTQLDGGTIADGAEFGEVFHQELVRVVIDGWGQAL